MDGLLTASFEAHNPAADRHRWYQVRVGRDLFGEWTLCLAFGRTGQAGRQLVFSASSAAPLKTKLRDHLRRRLSAPRRIGCAYRLVAVDAVADLDVPGWLTPALTTRLAPGDPQPHEHDTRTDPPIRSAWWVVKSCSCGCDDTLVRWRRDSEQ